MIHSSSAGTDLASAYDQCRLIAAQHGRTYYLATRLLPAARRPAIHALYAFARIVDDIVDIEAGTDLTWAESAAELDRIEKQLRRLTEWDGLATTTDDDARLPALLAVADTIARYDIAPEHFWVFLDAMRMDIPGTPTFRARYATMGDLRTYMRGSAAAIGLQLLPVLGTVVPVEEAQPAAAALGEAFQLTNFIRDVGEDLRRDRLYLPADELAAFGVDFDLLVHCQRTGTTDPRVRKALAHFAAVNRSIYRAARPGLDMLDPRVRPGLRAAFTLYSDILGRIEDNDFRVLDGRAVVPTSRRLTVAAAEMIRAGMARR